MNHTTSEASSGTYDEPGGSLVALDRARVARPLGRVAALPAPRVLIAEGQALVRAGFRVLLEGASHVSVVGEAAAEKALDVARRTRPQATLLDADLPAGDCVELTGRIRAETGAAVMLLTASEGDERIFPALRASAAGLVLKEAEPAELVRAIGGLAPGDVAVSPLGSEMALPCGPPLPSSSSAPTPPAPALARLLIKCRQLAVQDLLGQHQRLGPHRIDRVREAGVCRHRAGAKGLWRGVSVGVDHQIPPPARPRH
jgi:DNA-binding NarL/FixJ family response regulator